MRACGWARPTFWRSCSIADRTNGFEMWMRAMIWREPFTQIASTFRGRRERAYLRDDLEPDVDADPRGSGRDRAVDRLVVAVLEPERKEAKSVLQRVPLREIDGVEEA